MVPDNNLALRSLGNTAFRNLRCIDNLRFYDNGGNDGSGGDRCCDAFCESAKAVLCPITFNGFANVNGNPNACGGNDRDSMSCCGRCVCKCSSIDLHDTRFLKLFMFTRLVGRI